MGQGAPERAGQGLRRCRLSRAGGRASSGLAAQARHGGAGPGERRGLRMRLSPDPLHPKAGARPAGLPSFWETELLVVGDLASDPDSALASLSLSPSGSPFFQP